MCKLSDRLRELAEDHGIPLRAVNFRMADDFGGDAAEVRAIILELTENYYE